VLLGPYFAKVTFTIDIKRFQMAYASQYVVQEIKSDVHGDHKELLFTTTMRHTKWPN
jgi:hypothetical protein